MERPDYKIFTNNCQNFAKYLIEDIFPGSFCPATIENVLGRWSIFSAYSKAGFSIRRLPDPLGPSDRFLPIPRSKRSESVRSQLNMDYGRRFLPIPAD